MRTQSSPQDETQDAPATQSNSILASEPVVVAILLGQPDMGVHKFPFLQGNIKLKLDRSEFVRSVFIRSAYLSNRSMPEEIEFRAAQVFYKDGKIEEVRLAVSYPPNSEQTEGTEWRKWTTSVPPDFRIQTDGTLALVPEDEGRTHITACRRGSSLFLSWDVTSNACHEREEGVDLFSLDIPITDLYVEKGETVSGTPFEESRLDEAKRLLRQVPLPCITNILTPCVPTSIEPRGSSPSESEAWGFSFTADRTYLHYLLSAHYAANINTADFKLDVKKLAERNSISPDEAKVYLLVNHLERRDRFSRDGLPIFEERMWLTLSEMRKALLTLACVMTLYEWGGQVDEIEVSINNIKSSILNAVERITRRLMKTREAGRPEGSMTARTEEDVNRIAHGLEQRIFGAMAKVYSKARDETNVLKAEDAVTRKAVAAQLGKDRATLHNWTKSIGKDFDELKEIFLSKRNIDQQ